MSATTEDLEAGARERAALAAKPKLCIDCRWCRAGSNPENALCHHPNNYVEKISLVTGKSNYEYIGSSFCSIQRVGKTECGETGKFWEPLK